MQMAMRPGIPFLAALAVFTTAGADVLDVNSSLEISPGVKSIEKFAGFLAGLSFAENDMISKQPKTKRRMPCA